MSTKILLVEDDLDIREILTEELEEKGYEVTADKSGKETT